MEAAKSRERLGEELGATGRVFLNRFLEFSSKGIPDILGEPLDVGNRIGSEPEIVQTIAPQRPHLGYAASQGERLRRASWQLPKSAGKGARPS